VSHLLQIGGGDRYLEIGVANGETFQAVRARQRTAVDPCPVFAVDRLPPDCYVHPVSSDDFFASLPANWRTDAVLVDGLHEFRQTYRDVCFSLARLSPRGFVLIDDTVPTDALAALPDQAMAARLSRDAGLAAPRPWMGDVYKVVYALHVFHLDLEYFTMIGEGRPQTVVWRRRSEATPAVAPYRLSEIDGLAYKETWAYQLPEWFHPRIDADVFEEFEAHVRDQHLPG